MIVAVGLLLAAAWAVVSVAFPITTPGMRLAGPAELWPALLAFVGLALLAQGIFKEGYPGLSFFGIIFLFCGAFLSLFSMRIGGLGWVNLLQYWPVNLVVIGIAFMVLFVTRDMREQGLAIMSNVFTWIGLVALMFTLDLVSRSAFLEVLRYWPILLLVVAILIAGRRQQEGQGAGAANQ
jgi:hypothetical protein